MKNLLSIIFTVCTLYCFGQGDTAILHQSIKVINQQVKTNEVATDSSGEVIVRDTVTAKDSVYLADDVLPTVDTPKKQELVIRIDDYRQASDTDYLNAWEAAKAVIRKSGGGTIKFGTGVYEINTATNNATAWFVEEKNLKLLGEGADKTFLRGGLKSGALMNGASRQSEPYMIGFRNSQVEYLFTYKNTTKKGDRFIVLKDRSWADSIKVGQILHLTGGDHYFDQEFGELIKVIGNHNDTLFLADALSGSYSTDSVPYPQKLGQSFIMPPVGDTITVIAGGNMTGPAGRTISIGDNVFALLSSNGTTREFKVVNIGRGNSPAGTLIEAGEIMCKARAVLLWNHTENLVIQDLTLDARDIQFQGLRLDNTYNTLVKNVNVIRRSPIQKGSIYFTDFARKVKFEDCIFMAENWTMTQISRSAGDITLKRCVFNNVSFDASEFSFNVRVDSCIFNVTSTVNTKPFVLGNTVRTSWVTKNVFNIDTSGTVITSGEIQSPMRYQREFAVVDSNTFIINGKAVAIFDFPNHGTNYFTHNSIIGSGAVQGITSLNAIGDSSLFYYVNNHVDSNYVRVKITSTLMGNGFYNGTLKGNSFINTLTGSFVPDIFFGGRFTNVNTLSIIGNTFVNFRYYNTPNSVNVVITDNLFSK